MAPLGLRPNTTLTQGGPGTNASSYLILPFNSSISSLPRPLKWPHDADANSGLIVGKPGEGVTTGSLDYPVSMACLAVYLLLTLFVNSLTLVTVYRNRRMRNIRILYAAALSVADSLVAINALLTMLWLDRDIGSWFDTNPAWCTAFKIYLSVTITCSLTTVFLIAFDRVLFIRFPFFYLSKVTRVKAMTLIVSGWSLSLTFGTCLRVLPGPERYPLCSVYALLYDSDWGAQANAALFLFLSALPFLGHGIIYRSATKHAQAIHKHKKNMAVFTSRSEQAVSLSSPASCPIMANQRRNSSRSSTRPFYTGPSREVRSADDLKDTPSNATLSQYDSTQSNWRLSTIESSGNMSSAGHTLTHSSLWETEAVKALTRFWTSRIGQGAERKGRAHAVPKDKSGTDPVTPVKADGFGARQMLQNVQLKRFSASATKERNISVVNPGGEMKKPDVARRTADPDAPLGQVIEVAPIGPHTCSSLTSPRESGSASRRLLAKGNVEEPSIESSFPFSEQDSSSNVKETRGSLTLLTGDRVTQPSEPGSRVHGEGQSSQSEFGVTPALACTGIPRATPVRQFSINDSALSSDSLKHATSNTLVPARSDEEKQMMKTRNLSSDTSRMMAFRFSVGTSSSSHRSSTGTRSFSHKSNGGNGGNQSSSSGSGYYEGKKKRLFSSGSVAPFSRKSWDSSLPNGPKATSYLDSGETSRLFSSSYSTLSRGKPSSFLLENSSDCTPAQGRLATKSSSIRSVGRKQRMGRRRRLVKSASPNLPGGRASHLRQYLSTKSHIALSASMEQMTGVIRNVKDFASVRLRVAKKVVGVFVFCLVCWFPYIVLGLLGPTDASPGTVAVLGFLVMINSTANFVVYTLSDRSLRAAILSQFRCQKPHRSSSFRFDVGSMQ